MEPPVGFACIAPAHQGGKGGPDKLTIHKGEWAYCAFDARADGHVWGPTNGRTLTMLRQSALTRPKEHPKATSEA